MGLFDIFRKKQTPPTPTSAPTPPAPAVPAAAPVHQHQSLDTLLQRASTEVSVRAEFYKRLLSDELVVIVGGPDKPGGRVTLQKNEKVQLVTFPDGKIPLFTSTDRIFDKGIVKQEVPFLQMKGRDLFEMTRGAGFILNAYSDYGKELVPEEIAAMLNGSIGQSESKEIVYDKPTPVLLGQPSVQPTAIVNALRPLFESMPNIKAAYYAWMHNPESGEPAHYVFGIEGEGDMNQVMSIAGPAAQDATNNSQIIDFVVIQSGDTISDYLMQETRPFYVRR